MMREIERVAKIQLIVWQVTIACLLLIIGISLYTCEYREIMPWVLVLGYELGTLKGGNPND